MGAAGVAPPVHKTRTRGVASRRRPLLFCTNSSRTSLRRGDLLARDFAGVQAAGAQFKGQFGDEDGAARLRQQALVHKQGAFGVQDKIDDAAAGFEFQAFITENSFTFGHGIPEGLDAGAGALQIGGRGADFALHAELRLLALEAGQFEP